MKNLPTLDIVVPLYNESKNIEKLVTDTAASGLTSNGLRHMILVDNGSSDDTSVVLERLAKTYSWLKPVTLAVNRMYGGGLHYGMLQSCADYIGMVPGDNQVHPDDVLKVWERLLRLAEETRSPQVFVKGKRTVRHDSADIRFASRFYTNYANLILGLGVEDVNGHPKIFHRSLLNRLPQETMRTFTFDAQLLYAARQAGWHIAEEPVTFLARRHGVSSWAKKRLQIYMLSAKQIVEIKRLHRSVAPRSAAWESPKPII